MVPKDFYYFVISGFIVMALPIALIAWFQAGFFLKWLKARAGRGKFILIKQRGKIRDHFAIGVIKGDYLIYGKKENKSRSLVDKASIYTAWGVPCVDMDEATNNVARVDYSVLPGFDAEKYESLYTRALYRPSLDQPVDRTLLVLLIVILVAVVVVGFLVWNVSQQIGALGGGAVNSII